MVAIDLLMAGASVASELSWIIAAASYLSRSSSTSQSSSDP